MDKLQLILLAVIGLSSLCWCDNCTFPDFVANDPSKKDDLWVTSSPDSVITFSGAKMTIVETPWGIRDNKTRMVKTCTEVVNQTENVYAIKDGNTSTCMRFTKLTDNVIRLATATGSNCTGDFLPNETVLVASQPRSTKSVTGCTLKGGFLFTSQDVEVPNSKPTCDHPLPGRLESDCLPGEGLLLTYPDIYCIPPNTGWTPNQKLVCMDSWSEKGYDFTLLGTDYFQPKWCMRKASNSEGYLEIFAGKHCPTADLLSNGTQLTNFTLHALNSTTCTDDFVNCTTDYCTDAYRLYCRKTCKVCEGNPPNCTFNTDVVTSGLWSNGADKKTVKISDSEINYAGYTNFTCRKKVDQNSYVLKASAQKGCLPRLACGKFSRLSPAVLRYKFSQNLQETKDKFADCEESRFTDDPAPIEDQYRSRLYKNLIATDEALLKKTVSCALRGNFSISGLINNTPCGGDISALSGCEATNTMTASSNCTFKGEISCLGNVPSDAAVSQMMVVKRGSDVTCWVISSEDKETVSLLKSAQCNEDTPNQLKQQKVGVDGTLSALRVDSCDVSSTLEPTTTPTTTAHDTTTVPTTTAHNITTAHTTTASDTTATATTTKETPSTVTEVPSTNATTVTPSPTPAPHHGPSAGAVVGIVFLCLLISAGFVFLAYYLWKKYGHRRTPYSSLT